MKRNKRTWSLTDKEMNKLLGFIYQAQASYEELGFQNMAQEAAEVAEEIYNTLEDSGWFN